MLNMLIAIMGDTFGRIIEAKDVNAMKTKIELMTDLAKILDDKQQASSNEVFLFVVQPELDDED